MHDMTMSEVLKDPLIRQMLRADRVSLGVFAELLENAANQRARGFAASARPVSRTALLARDAKAQAGIALEREPQTGELAS